MAAALLSTRFLLFYGTGLNGFVKNLGWDHAYKVLLISFILWWFVVVIFLVGLQIALKWSVIGRLRPGAYDFDKSDYIQRWKMYTTMTWLTRRMGGNKVPGHVGGTMYVVWLFRAFGADIGEDVCLYPNGADPAMTEPDIVKIGDRAMLDSCSVIGHLNTRGFFRINPLRIGPDACLRANTRLQSGGEVGAGGRMLEHTLVMQGDIVDENGTVQGWPSEAVEYAGV